MHELFDQLLGYIKATWRYRWYAVGVAWVIALGGWAYVYTLPNRYEASARVYVDTQSVLRPLLAGLTIQPNVDQMVAMMSRTLISRPNVEKIIRMADMDIKLKTTEDREALIARLGKELRIGRAGGDNLYTIAYASQNPQEAKRVVQSLLTIFVEGSLGDKRKDSDGARRFLDEQLKVYSDRLIAAENAVTEFKRKNVAIMRGGQDYYGRLGEAQAALNQAELELKEVENARDAIKKQLAGEETPSLLDEKGPAPTLEVANPELDARISSLEQKLDGLRLTYTEQHPDIIAINKMIGQLKEQKKTDAKNRKAPSPSAQTQQAQNPIYQQLTVSLTQAEASVASMKARVAEYRKRLDFLKGAVNAQPQVEAEYVQLTRDYNVTQRNYETLLSRRESAQMSGEMESNANVLDFRVIDPPTVPSYPNAPNRTALTSGVLVIAIGAGIGIAFLLSQIRPTFSDEKRLREVSGMPVFGTVIMAWTDAQRGKRRKRLIAFILSFLSLFSAYGALMAMLMLMAPKT
ncbi:MAG TPA: XrtA system polysaccharide chain length determinant [Burkholderiales bacterium]|nr:XrtA system polysaccharide chain length determinant [Burkholderiales bacterium]